MNAQLGYGTKRYRLKPAELIAGSLSRVVASAREWRIIADEVASWRCWVFHLSSIIFFCRSPSSL